MNSVAVSMHASQACDPGSSPGSRSYIFCIFVPQPLYFLFFFFILFFNLSQYRAGTASSTAQSYKHRVPSCTSTTEPHLIGENTVQTHMAFFSFNFFLLTILPRGSKNTILDSFYLIASRPSPNAAETGHGSNYRHGSRDTWTLHPS